MTSSAGTSGLILLASPPRSAIASRMAARSTTAGTPVKSCMTTRAGVKAISSLGSALASQRASFSMSSAWTEPLPSVRSRFSSSTLRLKGSRATSYFDCSASRRKIVCSRSPTFRVSLASNEFGCLGHGQGPFRRRRGAARRVPRRGVVRLGSGRSKVRMRFVRRQAGERDQRGIGEPEPRVAPGDRDRLAQRVRPPADAVGAGFEVGPQRLCVPARAQVLRRRGSPSRPPRAAVVTRSSSAVAIQSATSRWSGSAASYSATTTLVSRTTVNPRRSRLHHLVPIAPDAQAVVAAEDADMRLRPPRLLHRGRQSTADELGFGEALVGGAAGESLVQIGIQIEARLLHPT